MNYQEINTFEKVLAFKGETTEQFNQRTAGMEPDEVGYQKCKAIAFAMNGGKHVTKGYEIWFFNPNKSASGFSFHVVVCDVGSAVGSRLLIENREAAKFAGKTFPKEYSLFINARED
jgi:hypothetical protein